MDRQAGQEVVELSWKYCAATVERSWNYCGNIVELSWKSESHFLSCGLDQRYTSPGQVFIFVRFICFSVYVSVRPPMCGLRDQVMVNLVADKHKLQLGE